MMTKNSITIPGVKSFAIDLDLNRVTILGREYAFSDIIDFTFVDNSYIRKIGGSTVTTTDSGSMLGRAIVGGLLFGGVGAMVGGMTASQKTEVTEGTELKVESYAIQITVNDFEKPLIYLTFSNNFSVATLVASYLRVIIHRNHERGNDDRIKYYRLLRELKQMRDEGLMSIEEYDKEVLSVKEQFSFIMRSDEAEAIRLQLQEQKAREEAELIAMRQAEAERKLREKEEAKELLAQNREKYISSKTSVNGVIVGDVIIVNETGDATPVVGFTEDGKVLCEVDGELQILTFDEIETL